MTYLFCTVFMQIMAIRQFFTIATLNAKAGADRRVTLVTGTALLIAAGLLSAPIILEVAQGIAMKSGKPVSLGGKLRPLWFMGAAAVLILSVFSYRMATQVKAKTSRFFAVGANVFGLFIGLYLTLVVADQLSFYRSFKDTGVLSWTHMKDDPALRDVQCDSTVIIVRGFESGLATYRCPMPLQIIYGSLSGAPILPWPGFTEGKSAELAQALKKMQNEATYIEAKR